MLIGLLKAHAGFGPTMTFLFTSPLLNPIIIALFIPVLGLEVTLWYTGLALTTSIFAGVALQHFGFDRYIKQEMLETKKSTCNTGCGSVQETSCCGSAVKSEPTIWNEAWNESWTLFRSMFPYMFIAMFIGRFCSWLCARRFLC